MTTPTSTDTCIEWTEEARQTYLAMAYHVASLSSAYGPTHRWYIEAAGSFVNISRDLVAFRKLRISKDGPLSLLGLAGNDAPLVFGLIFHGVDRGCTKDGCKAILNNEGKVWKYMPEWPECEDGQHEWLYPIGAPVPGTWSFHS